MGFISEKITYDLVAILATIIVTVIGYLKWKLSYWNRVGLQTLSPTVPWGDAKDALQGRLSTGEQFREFYVKFKARGLKHGGAYVGIGASYVPVDPEIIQHILITDFQYFMDHGSYFDKEADPLSAHLFNLQDTEWRNLRVKLTPTFTSSKMKMMFQTMADRSVGLKDILDIAADSGSPVDIKHILGRFTADVIGSCAFGLECNSLKDPDAEFFKYAKETFKNKSIFGLKVLFQMVVPPRILKLLKYKFTKIEVERFFMNAIKETVEHREKNNIYRKDFMHLLLQLKNRGKVEDDKSVTDEDGQIQEKGLTMNELSAQAFIFFVAGFETSATTMTFALYELAVNSKIQDKLREEINKVLDKYDGKVTYDGIMEMTYMENVLYEALRKHPPAPLIQRICTKDYIIPNTNILIRKGINVGISALGIHTNPDYYPEPEKFDPDRFLEENKKSRPACTWLPFGDGPRTCIGLRFAIMQSKMGLATLLKNYRIKLSSKTKLPLIMEKRVKVASVQGGIWLEVEKLQ